VKGALKRKIKRSQKHRCIQYALAKEMLQVKKNPKIGSFSGIPR